MKTENILDAMGALEESMLMESLPKKRRNLRPLAAVAILAAALCVTAGAVGMIAPAIVAKGDRQMVQLEYGGVDWPAEKIQEMFDAAEKQRAVSKMPLTRFDSLEEMEADLELELLNSRLRTLEGCHYKVFGSRNGSKWVFVYYYPWDGTRIYLDGGDLNMVIGAYITPEANSRIAWVLPEEEPFAKAKTAVYEIKDLGVAARIRCDQDGAKAWFVKDGIGYEVTCDGGFAEMETVLDSFHY